MLALAANCWRYFCALEGGAEVRDSYVHRSRSRRGDREVAGVLAVFLDPALNERPALIVVQVE